MSDRQIAITTRRADEAFAVVAGAPDATDTDPAKTVRVDEFVADVIAAADALPSTPAVINLCSERYSSTVQFFAACLAGITTYLPAQRDGRSIDELAARTGAMVLSDVVVEPGSHGRVDPTDQRAAVSADLAAAVVTTSGSTGAPVEHAKTWALLDSFRRIHARVLADASEPSAGGLLIATVPSWHMYGLEWALLLPTLAPLTLYCGPDFYPDDVRRASRLGFELTERPGTLISTPVHLKALLRTDLRKELPAEANAAMTDQSLALTVSATAPIDQAFATDVEQRLGGRLLEIYGCSEIGSLARRMTSEQSAWRFFSEFSLDHSAAEDDETLTVGHPLLPNSITLSDRFTATTDGFTLIGRATDTVKVGGKRDSLARLNVVLQGTAGVIDGVFYNPVDFGLSDTGRLEAVVSTDGTDVSAIRRALAAELDPVFLPRPLRQVSELPRSASGKLQRQALRALLHELQASPSEP